MSLKHINWPIMKNIWLKYLNIFFENQKIHKNAVKIHLYIKLFLTQINYSN